MFYLLSIVLYSKRILSAFVFWLQLVEIKQISPLLLIASLPSFFPPPHFIKNSDELREIIQSTIAYEQEAKEEESPIQHVQKEAEVLLKAIKEAQSKTDPKDHFSNTSGFNH
mmetsp:Transcript_30073/g.40153  ORF Transcript_30073/g.40153 Transcript_30073/m.40153 type:complete len:112 (-) Transcript_30073:726-1061(-)